MQSRSCNHWSLAMARKGIFLCAIILFFLRFGRAQYCSDDSNCAEWSGESCCSDYVCRRKCDSCSYDFECGSGEKCCDGGVCSSSCPTTSPSTYCTDKSDCDQWSGESCCLDGVCRRNCYYCSYNSDCGTGEKCCNGGNCLSSCPTTESPWDYHTLAPYSPWNYLTDFPTLATVAPISYCTFDSDCELDDVCCDGDCMVSCTSSWSGSGILAAVVSIIGFFGVVFSIVACYYCAWCPYYRYRSPGAVIVTGQVPYRPFVTTTQTTMTQNIPPPNYNQPPPPASQPPPPYSSCVLQPAQHPPPAPASGQASTAPKVTA